MIIPESDTPLIPTWSYSRLMNWERCPYMVYLSAVEKAPGPERGPDHPLERGNRIHKLAEDFVQGEIDALPKELSRFRDEFFELRAEYEDGKLEIEQPWGYDVDWTPCDWWGDNVWARIKLDVFQRIDDNTARVIDHKTGKKLGNEVKHGTQGQLYAIAAFLRYPEIEVVESTFWYLDKGGTLPKTYRRDQIAGLLAAFNRRAERMTKAVVYPPKPNRFNCKFCDYGRNGTDVCPFSAE